MFDYNSKKDLTKRLNLVKGRAESSLKMMNNNVPLHMMNNEICSLVGVANGIKNVYFKNALTIRIDYHIEQVKTIDILTPQEIQMFDHIDITSKKFTSYQLCKAINSLEKHYSISYPLLHSY
jgi:DNA-binding FrmR family transcriptional regulator